MTALADCALAGETCVAGTTQALCALGTCSQPPSLRFCQGEVAGYCAAPFLLGTDCAKEGAHCTPPDTPDGGAAHCTGDGAPCITDACKGPTTLAPCLDLRAGAVPCAPGQRCFPASMKLDHATCGLAGDCDPQSFFDDCTAGVLTFCRQGIVQKIDCRASGFADCTSSPASGCTVELSDAAALPLPDAPLP